jgi:hypothetical protein
MRPPLPRHVPPNLRLAGLALLCCFVTADRLVGQDPELPFPLLLEREQLDAGNPLAPYQAMLELEDRYLASPAFQQIYPEIRASFEEFMGVPLAGVRAMALPTLRRGFASDSQASLDGFAPQDAVEVIASRAAGTQLVIWGEEHHLPQTRSLYEALLHRLRDEGYRYLAAEAFAEAIATSEFVDVGYEAGLYLWDPVFAAAVRTAVELGYQLVAYDTSERGPEGEAGFRDRRQAENIITRVFEGDPDAKVLVLTGRGHASETPASDGWRPMAAVLKDLTGLDPLTIYAPTMSMRETPEEEHPLYRVASARDLLHRPTIFVDTASAEPLGAASFDAYVFWPRVEVETGRESWVFRLPGRRKVEIPLSLPQGTGPILVQAFEEGRPDRMIPDDQVLFLGGSVPALALAAGSYRIRAIRPDGEVIAEQTAVVEHGIFLRQ